jgi:DNA-binding response OmpR family regulator
MSATVVRAVVILAWPAGSAERDALARDGVPRLLVVDQGVNPPPLVDCLEDWVQAPATEAELRARREALAVRAGCHHRLVPHLDDEGFLSFGTGRVHLPPVEARLAAALLDRYGAVVSAARLSRAGWPETVPTRGMLDVRIHRLRRRLEPLGLVLRTVRQRGWILEPA